MPTSPADPNSRPHWADGEWNAHRSSRKESRRRRQRWAELRAAMTGEEPVGGAPDVGSAGVTPPGPPSTQPVAGTVGAVAPTGTPAAPLAPGDAAAPVAPSVAPSSSWDVQEHPAAATQAGPTAAPAAGAWATQAWDTRQPEAPLPPWTRRDTLVLLVLVVVAVAWTIAAIWTGAPILGRSWAPAGLIGVVGVVLSGLVIRRYLQARDPMPLGSLVLVGLVGLGMLGSFAWGVTHSVVIRDQIYLSTSREARSHRLVEELRADRRSFTGVDRLLALDPSAARTRYLELKPAQLSMEAMADRWNNVQARDLPDARFMPAVEHARAAAYFAGLALERKQSLLGVQDQQVAAELDSYRSSFITSALALSRELAPLAGRYGVGR